MLQNGCSYVRLVWSIVVAKQLMYTVAIDRVEMVENRISRYRVYPETGVP